MNKVYVCHKIPEAGLNLLNGKVEYRCWDGDGPVPRNLLLKEISDVDGVITMLTEKVDSEFFDNAPRVKVVSNYAVGYNNVDVEEATSRGVKITNTPGVLTEATADIAFGLLVAASRRFTEAERYLRSGKWTCWHPTMLLGREIFGKTLGLIGFGRIGKAVARRAAGFGMKVIYHTPSGGPATDQGDGPRWVSFEEILEKSDYLSLHCPLNDRTRGLIGKKELERMKQDAVLVNTSRGPVVDQTSLYESLRDGVIGAAGLDVYDEEPISPEDPLLSLENVVMLPHIGSATREARDAMATMATSNMLDVLEGKEPRNPVN